MSFKVTGRKVKSLNDIPHVFNIYNNMSDGAELKISKEVSEATTEDYEKLDKSAGDAQDNPKTDDEKEEEGKTLEDKEASEVKIIKQQGSNLKINLLDKLEVQITSKEESLDYKVTYLVSGKLRKKKRILSLADTLISMIFITPLTIGYWRGIWTLMDLHPDRFPGTWTFVFGIVVHVIFAAFKNCLHARATGPSRKKNLWNKTLFKTAQILYTYVFGVACNAHWRGGWIIFDYYVGGHIWTSTVTVLVVLTLLAALRSIRNILAVPLMIMIDRLSVVFYFPTRYKLCFFVTVVQKLQRKGERFDSKLKGT